MSALDRARAAARAVVDPELPMLTLADLGVLRGVDIDAAGTVEVTITPTYTGCPAMAAMRDDLVHRLRADGFADVRVKVVLDPPWTTDWIAPEARRTLAAAGISPPGPAGRGRISLTLGPARRDVRCPRCGSRDVEATSEFGPTACTALYRCRACLEPFEHVKERP